MASLISKDNRSNKHDPIHDETPLITLQKVN